MSFGNIILEHVTLVHGFVAISCLLLGSYYYYKNLFSFWSKKNVPGPKPWLVLGNLPELLFEDRRKVVKAWARDYGRVFGIFKGSEPTLVVSDAEVMTQVCVKDFDVFPNHMFDFLNKYQKSFLFMSRDEHWKRVRALISPTMSTSGNLRRMYNLIDLCSHDLLQCFGEQFKNDDTEADIRVTEIFDLYSMDGVASCLYGLKLAREGSSDLKSMASRNEFVRLAPKLEFAPHRFAAIFCLPKSLLDLFGFELLPEKIFTPMSKIVERLIEARKKSDKKFNDYLQLLIDARIGDKLELDELDIEENHHAGLTTESLLRAQKDMVAQSGETNSLGAKAKLSDLEIISSGILLLSVGFETTSTLLSNCTYALSQQSVIQERLYQEVKQISSTESGSIKFDYQALTSCVYLDAVISETLRVLGPVMESDRTAVRDYRVEKYNIDIKKGAKLMLNFRALMSDPEYWPEPDKFDPDRFLPENRGNIVPGSYCPFGIGPRHCIGMRFALTEVKLAIAKIIMNYRLEPGANARNPPEIMNFSGSALMVIKNNSIRFIKRKRDVSNELDPD